MKELKEALLRQCTTNLKEQEKQLRQNLQSIKDSRNSETKSSAGDKFETGRAMMQAEEDKLSGQLNRLLLEIAQVEQISRQNGIPEQVGIGSMVVCKGPVYFVGLGLGKVVVEDRTIFCLSAQAPIASYLLGKKAGDVFSFNGRSHKILELF